MRISSLQASSLAMLAAILLCQATALRGLADTKTPRDVEAIKAEVEALRKDDVVWRKIEWKTCLLEGLQASREQNKPIILWIFIDRPIDDERC